MKLNNTPTLLIAFCILVLILSCTSKGTHISFMKTDFDNIYMSYNDTIPVTLHFNDLDSMEVTGNDTFSVKNIMDRLSIEKNKRYAIAYSYCQKGFYRLHIKVNNKKGELLADTTLAVTFPTVNGTYVKEAKIIKANVCPYILQNCYNGDRKIPIQNWLFDNNYPLDSALINKMEGIVNYLCGIAYPTYNLSRAHSIPRFNKVQKSLISVRTNIYADRYFLLAASSASALLTKIKNLIIHAEIRGLQRKDGILTGIPLNLGQIGNVMSIFLIGINNDKTYSILPIGAYIIDNSNPYLIQGGFVSHSIFSPYNSSISLPNTENISPLYFDFKNIGFIVQHDVNLKIDGYARLTYGRWDGNSIDGINIPFTLYSGGDIKTIEIFRTKGNEWGVRPGKKTVNVNGRNLDSYHFDFTLLLRTGDNYIPIVITDLRGNKSKIDYYIPTERRAASNRNNDGNEDDIDDLRSKYNDLEDRISELENP